MPIEHLRQIEIYNSETVNDSVNLTTFSPVNLQDDLNLLRTVLKAVLGGNTYKDISNIYSLKQLKTWRDTLFSSSGLRANYIDLSVVTDPNTFPIILNTNGTWQKLSAFSSYLNENNKLTWSGLSYTTTELDNAVSVLPVITTLSQEIYGSPYPTLSGNPPILTRLQTLSSSITPINENITSLSTQLQTISIEIYGSSSPYTTNNSPILTRLENIETTFSTQLRTINMEIYGSPSPYTTNNSPILTRLENIETTLNSLSNVRITNLESKIGAFTYSDYLSTINAINNNLFYLFGSQELSYKNSVVLKEANSYVLDVSGLFGDALILPNSNLFDLLFQAVISGIYSLIIPVDIYKLYSSLTTVNTNIVQAYRTAITNGTFLPNIHILLLLNEGTDSTVGFSYLKELASLEKIANLIIQIEPTYAVYDNYQNPTTASSVDMDSIKSHILEFLSEVENISGKYRIYTNDIFATLRLKQLTKNKNLEVFTSLVNFWQRTINSVSIDVESLIENLILVDDLVDTATLCTNYPNLSVCKLFVDSSTYSTRIGINPAYSSGNFSNASDIALSFINTRRRKFADTLWGINNTEKNRFLYVYDATSSPPFFLSGGIKEKLNYKNYKKFYSTDNLKNITCSEADLVPSNTLFYKNYSIPPSLTVSTSLEGVYKFFISPYMSEKLNVEIKINGFGGFDSTYISLFRVQYDEVSGTFSFTDLVTSTTTNINSIPITPNTPFPLHFILKNTETGLTVYIGTLENNTDSLAEFSYTFNGQYYSGSLKIDVSSDSSNTQSTIISPVFY